MKNSIQTFLALLMVYMIPSSACAQQATSVIDAESLKVKVEAVTLYDRQGIPFLKWNQEVYDVENAAWVNFANIRGRFSQKVASATLNARSLTVAEDGSFNARLEYAGKEKSFIITVIDESKKLFRMQYKLIPLSSDLKPLPESKAQATFRWRFSAGTGLTLISYRQRNVRPFDQWTLTLKGAAIYRAIPSRLDLGLNAFYNVWPISSNSTEGYKIRYLGVNARAGLHLTDPSAVFRVVLNGGFYFNTSFGTIGFADMYGPQIFPEFLYVFQNGHTLYNYFKYSYSLSNSTGISFKENREVATGLHYSLPVSGNRRLSFGLDLSQLTLNLGDEWASTNTYTLSAGLSF